MFDIQECGGKANDGIRQCDWVERVYSSIHVLIHPCVNSLMKHSQFSYHVSGVFRVLSTVQVCGFSHGF